MARYGSYIDVSRCIGCYTCAVACKNWYRIEAGKGARIKIREVIKGKYPKVSYWIFPTRCMHCDNPSCVPVCPTQALYTRKDGIVALDEKKCTGCKSCLSACPYQAPYFDQKKGVVDKCDLCAERIDSGLKPYCMESCAGAAMIFGDLDEPNSEISKLIVSEKAFTLSSQLGTGPKVYYANMTRAVNPFPKKMP